MARGRKKEMLEYVKCTHWRGKLLKNYTKEELIDCISDAHHLWREECQKNIDNLISSSRRGENFMEKLRNIIRGN